MGFFRIDYRDNGGNLVHLQNANQVLHEPVLINLNSSWIFMIETVDENSEESKKARSEQILKH